MKTRQLVRRFARSLILITVIFASAPATCETAIESGITGVVFEDLNGNGALDPEESGIQGVVVSDQIEAVATDANGRFELASRGRYGLITMTTPSGHESLKPFWRRTSDTVTALEFPLIRRAADTSFTFLHASDTHITADTVQRTTMLRRLVAELQPDLVLITGDLVADAAAVPEARARADFELLLQEIGAIALPVFTVPGNRDIFGAERHNSLVSEEHPLFGKEMYRRYLGPTYYSFDRGGVHFIAIDSVVYHKLWYYGHVDETQLEWLKADLAHVAADTPVVTFQHIPLVTGATMLLGFRESLMSPSILRIEGKARYRYVVDNFKEVLAALKPFHFTLALAGHLHMAERLSYEAEGFATRFHLAAAVINEVPESRVGMRMISGVSLYTVRNGVIDNGVFHPLETSAESQSIAP